jgi:hypothetical protein
MAVSAARLEANRRNAQKSTGPRTHEGKTRSRVNAVTHGLRAEIPILPDEDPQALEDRKAAWTAALAPCDDVEQRAVDDAVAYSWQQDRARRAQVARVSANRLDHGLDLEQITEEEVLDLGRLLFTDRLGPLPFYPTGCDYDQSSRFRSPSTSYAGDKKVDLDPPDLIVSRLRSTLRGCEWLLTQWSELRSTLERGQPWISSDKLKAVRLLGKQPFDAIDDREVALVFLASAVLKPNPGGSYHEIAVEMRPADRKKFRECVQDRQLASLKPADAAEARVALLALVERATASLSAKQQAHHERARVKAELAADILAFDDSPEGERLRRHELASGRAIGRSLDRLVKLRRSIPELVSGPLCVVSCHPDDVVAEPDAPREPTDHRENLTNEPNASNENTTNEPIPIAGIELDQLLERVDDTNDSVQRNSAVEIDVEKRGEWARAEIEKLRERRAERLRKLNAESKREAQQARAARQAVRGRPKTGDTKKPPDQRTSPTASAAKPKTKRQEGKELEMYLNVLHGFTKKSGQARR